MTRRGVLGVCILLAATLVTGCFTGQRPRFNTDPFSAGTPTGDAAIDDVLQKLDAVTRGPATAVYAVLTKFGNTQSSATVVLLNERRSVEVGTAQFTELGGERYTCTVDTTTHVTTDCVNGFDAARISNVGITIEFYASEAATRLRRDAQAQLSPAVAHDEVIANQNVSCVSVALTGGTAEYCVLENGLLALLDDGDVLITLGLLTTTVDDAKLQPPIV